MWREGMLLLVKEREKNETKYNTKNITNLWLQEMKWANKRNPLSMQQREVPIKRKK